MGRARLLLQTVIEAGEAGGWADTDGFSTSRRLPQLRSSVIETNGRDGESGLEHAYIILRSRRGYSPFTGGHTLQANARKVACTPKTASAIVACYGDLGLDGRDMLSISNQNHGLA